MTFDPDQLRDFAGRYTDAWCGQCLERAREEARRRRLLIAAGTLTTRSVDPEGFRVVFVPSRGWRADPSFGRSKLAAGTRGEPSLR